MSFIFSLIWLLQSLTIANAGILGARVPAVTPAGEIACEYVVVALSICESVSPGFTTLAPSMQAPCLCYSSTVWDPNLFDDYVLTCAAYASTALPADYSAIVGLEGFCSSIGNVLTQPASVPAHTTPPPSQSTAVGGDLDSNPGCSLVSFALSYCISASPGFTTLAPSLQAPCLCYSSTSWDPSLFDNAVATCAEYASTAVPSDYSAFSALEGFCSSVGNVLSQPVSVPAQTTTQIAISTTPPPSQSTAVGGDLDSNPGCSLVSFALSYCISASPGFTALAPSLQAPCLCYSSTSWDPSLFDNAVATCAEYASTAVPSDYSAFSALEGFCTSVGNVLAMTTSAISTTSTYRMLSSTSALTMPATTASKAGAESLAKQDGLMIKWFLSMFSVVFSLLFYL